MAPESQCLSFQVLLRVKESEIQYLKQEISSLKDELQTALRVSTPRLPHDALSPRPRPAAGHVARQGRSLATSHPLGSTGRFLPSGEQVGVSGQLSPSGSPREGGGLAWPPLPSKAVALCPPQPPPPHTHTAWQPQGTGLHSSNPAGGCLAPQDKKYASDKYKDIYTELSIAKAKADCDISRLKEQLKAATEALGEKPPESAAVGYGELLGSLGGNKTGLNWEGSQI